ncbi:short-chain dehydrogenase [Streptomyces cellulosae]
MIARLRRRRAERDGTYDELVARRTKAVARLPGRQGCPAP